MFEYKTRGSKLKSVKYPKLDITFMTVHMAKGLGYDNVIVVNGKNETYGFPSKIEDDPVLSFVIKGDNSIDYAEERRLFYVAMTRTKNRVYFIAPEQNPSEFLLEIKHDYKSVVLKGNWSEEKIKHNIARKPCPICGYPMQYRYKNAYGLRLYICTNDPELCGFMTNDVKAGKLSIIKCEKCRDGYLIVRPGNNGSYFLGCTNYKPNRTGCNNTFSADDYYVQMGLERELAPAVSPVKGIKIQPKTRTEDVKKGNDKELAEEIRENSNPIDKVIQPIVIEHKKKEERINPVDIILFPSGEEESATEDNKEVLLFPEYEQKVKNVSEKYPTADMKVILKQMLSALNHISEERFYGVGVFVEVLRGSKGKNIQKYGLQDVPEYGSCSFMSVGDVRAAIQWLMDNHFIIQTRGMYPKLHITYEGNHFEEVVTPRMIKKFIKYLDDPNRESFDDIKEEDNE